MTVSLSVLERRLLQALPADGTSADAEDVAKGLGLGSAGEVLRAASGPERHGLVKTAEATQSWYRLTDEGARYKAEGLPERRAVEAVLDGGGKLAMGDLATRAGLEGPEVKVAIGWLKRKGWAALEQGALTAEGGPPDQGADEEIVAAMTAGEAADGLDTEVARELVQRGVLEQRETTHRSLHLTAAGQDLVKGLDDVSDVTEINQVTPGLIAAWQEMDDEAKAEHHVRPFDFDVPVAPRHAGKPHPLTQLMTQTRDIFWRMGFQEIRGDFVESAFWNMDALFIPQDHPAREMQDTFYLQHPAALDVDEEDLARGKAVHERGGDTGSSGWGGIFDEDVARQALLRTHTTNTTVRYLAQNPTGAHKVFGLGRVFRKETMDATHLPEFHQIEGIVMEDGATFDMLVGLCRHFFTQMGFPEVRFRPAYFPYTEPSMEIDVKYQGKWMELGGCGVFRPEVTEPLGCEHPVLAWGFGLERLAMMRLGLQDIRQLYVSDIRWLKENPLL